MHSRRTGMHTTLMVKSLLLLTKFIFIPKDETDY